MELSSLHPQDISFTALDLPLTFRAFRLIDQIQAEKRCGGRKNVQKIFDDLQSRNQAIQEPALEKFFVLAWYQLDIESQGRIIDEVRLSSRNPDTGEEESLNLTPVEKFKSLFLNRQDYTDLMLNFVRCQGANIPDIPEEELKNASGQATMNT